MKKLITLFALIFLIFSFRVAYADLTYYKKGKLDGNGVRTYRWECVDTDDLECTSTVSDPLSGYIIGIRIMPDDSGSLVLNCEQLGCVQEDNTPASLWDLTLKDQYGFDILLGEGANLNNTNSIYKTPVTQDSSSNNISLIYINGAKLRPRGYNMGSSPQRGGFAVELYLKEQGAVRGRP